MSSNSITNFAVYTLDNPDVLPPTFARDLGIIITALQNAYNKTQTEAEIAEFLAHITNTSNPHHVTASQISVDGPFMLSNIYAYYLSVTLDVPVMTESQLAFKLTNLIQAATNLNTGSLGFFGAPVWIIGGNALQIISAELMNILYGNHNESLAAHPSIQAEWQPDYQTPVPTFVMSPTAMGSDVYIFNNGAMQFLSGLAYLDVLTFAIQVPIFPQESDAQVQYSNTLDITKYTPVVNGTIVLQAYINPDNVSNVSVLTLTNSNSGDNINVYQNASSPGVLNVDITYQGTTYHNVITGDNGTFYLYMTYMTNGIVLNVFNPTYGSSPVNLSGMFFLFTQLAMSLNVESSDPNACINFFGVYPGQLTETQAQLVFGLIQ